MWQKNGTIIGTGRGKLDYKVGKRKEEESIASKDKETHKILSEESIKYFLGKTSC